MAERWGSFKDVEAGRTYDAFMSYDRTARITYDENGRIIKANHNQGGKSLSEMQANGRELFNAVRR